MKKVNKEYESISKTTIRRYSERFKTFQHNIKTLGWGSKEMQEYRFKKAIEKVDITNKTILDIGCGFGDLYNYLRKEKYDFLDYIGWDINKDLIKNTLINEEKVKLEIVDIALQKPKKEVASIGFMFGLLNWKLDSEEKNYQYSIDLIESAFNAVSETLIVDFLSTNYYEGYPIEDFVFYHDPAIMIKRVNQLTCNFELIHNYKPIPQKEFMLILHK